jgi:hypothetical protein
MIPGISPSVGSASGGNSNYPRQTVLDGRCFEAVFLQSLFDELDKRTRRVEGQRKKIVTITPGAHRTIWPACDTQSSAFLCNSAGKACHVLAARHASLFVLLRADSGDQCKRKLASQAPKSHSATMLAKPKRIANTVRKCGILLFLRSCHQDGAKATSICVAALPFPRLTTVPTFLGGQSSQEFGRDGMSLCNCFFQQ